MNININMDMNMNTSKYEYEYEYDMASGVDGKKAPLLVDERVSRTYLLAPAGKSSVHTEYRVDNEPCFGRVSTDRDVHRPFD